MRKLVSLIAGAGDWLVSLSDRARMQLVVITLLVLLSGGIYKLTKSIERLNQPLPTASTDQLLQPMERLFKRTKDKVSDYQSERKREASQLDSLAKVYSTKTDLPQ